MGFKEEFSSYVRAGYPLLYVTASEPERAVSSIEKLSAEIGENGTSVFTWRFTSGWNFQNPGSPSDPLSIFEDINRQPNGAIAIAQNYHAILREPDINFIQPLIDGYYNWRLAENKRTLVIYSKFPKS